MITNIWKYTPTNTFSPLLIFKDECVFKEKNVIYFTHTLRDIREVLYKNDGK